MFELIGLGAAVVCWLKGRRLKGALLFVLVAAVIVIAITPLARFGYFAGGLVVAAVGIALALPMAEPGSWWDRLYAVDQSGTRLISLQPRSERVRHAAVGALAGLGPGALSFATGALVFGDEEEMLTIGIMSIGLMLAGAVIGAIIGYNRVPPHATS